MYPILFKIESEIIRITLHPRQTCYARRDAWMPQLAAIAIENNPNPYRISKSTQVGKICCEFSGENPGDCCLPDSRLFAYRLLADAAILRYFCEAGGYETRVVHN